MDTSSLSQVWPIVVRRSVMCVKKRRLLIFSRSILLLPLQWHRPSPQLLRRSFLQRLRLLLLLQEMKVGTKNSKLLCTQICWKSAFKRSKLMIFIHVALFFVLALRGPPLDENLLLSNIATANKKVEHLTEVTQCLLRSCLVRIVLWITTRMVVLGNILSCFWNRRWLNPLVSCPCSWCGEYASFSDI